jgi:hypothetical protein
MVVCPGNEQGASMQERRARLETLLKEAANCQLVSNMATNAAKKGLFARLA